MREFNVARPQLEELWRQPLIEAEQHYRLAAAASRNPDKSRITRPPDLHMLRDLRRNSGLTYH
jgi:hypothetical protein